MIIYKYLYEQNNKDKKINEVILYSLKDTSVTPLLKKDGKINFDILLKQLKIIIADINNDEPFKRELYDKEDCEQCPYFYLCR